MGKLDSKRARGGLKPITELHEPPPLSRIRADPSMDLSIERELGLDEEEFVEPSSLPIRRGRAVFTGEALDAICMSPSSTMVCTGGARGVLKVYTIHDDNTVEQIVNYRNISAKKLNLLYSPLDVSWNHIDESCISSASTNGAVVFWSMVTGKINGHYKKHTRSTTTVKFHCKERDIILSGSKDANVFMYDMRCGGQVASFSSGSFDAIRDMQWSMHDGQEDLFAASDDQGIVRIWDRRKSDKPYLMYHAHNGYTSSVQFSPKARFVFATGGGRDRYIKIWDLSRTVDEGPIYTFENVAPVGRALWRPHGNGSTQMASCSVVNDTAVNFWDIRRPYVPYATFHDHNDSVCAIDFFKNDESRFLSGGKDGLLVVHSFLKDARYPINYANDISVATAPDGLIGVAVNSLAPEKVPFEEKQSAHSFYSNPKGITKPPLPHSILFNVKVDEPPSEKKKSARKVGKKKMDREEEQSPSQPAPAAVEEQPPPPARPSSVAAIRRKSSSSSPRSPAGQETQPIAIPSPASIESLMRMEEEAQRRPETPEEVEVVVVEEEKGEEEEQETHSTTIPLQIPAGAERGESPGDATAPISILKPASHGEEQMTSPTAQPETAPVVKKVVIVEPDQEPTPTPPPTPAAPPMSISAAMEAAAAANGCDKLSTYDPFRGPTQSLIRCGQPEHASKHLTERCFVELALEYRMGGATPPQLAGFNSDVAERHGLHDVARTWRLMTGLIMHELRSGGSDTYPIEWTMDELDRRRGRKEQLANQLAEEGEFMSRTVYAEPVMGEDGTVQLQPVQTVRLEVDDPEELLTSFILDNYEPGFRDDVLLRTKRRGRKTSEGPGMVGTTLEEMQSADEDDEVDDMEEKPEKRTTRLAEWRMRTRLRAKDKSNRERVPRTEAASPIHDPMDDDDRYGAFGEYHSGLEPTDVRRKTNEDLAWHGKTQSSHTWRILPDEAFPLRQDLGVRADRAGRSIEEDRECGWNRAKRKGAAWLWKDQDNGRLPNHLDTSACNVYDILKRHADANDIQTCAVISIVFGQYLSTLLNEAMITSWIAGYETILDRLRLMTAVTELRKYCLLPLMQQKSLSGTYLKIGCQQCRKLITNGECERCEAKVAAGLCSVCHRELTGLTWSCDGCRHASHSSHAQGWFERHDQCPVKGCDCECVYWKPCKEQPLLLRPKNLKKRPEKAPQPPLTVENFLLCDQIMAARLQEKYFARREARLQPKLETEAYLEEQIMRRNRLMRKLMRRGIDVEKEEFDRWSKLTSSSDEQIVEYEDKQRKTVKRRKAGIDERRRKQILRGMQGSRSCRLNKLLEEAEKEEMDERRKRRARQLMMRVPEEEEEAADDEKQKVEGEQGEKETAAEEDDADSDWTVVDDAAAGDIEWAGPCHADCDCYDCTLMRPARRQFAKRERASGARLKQTAMGANWTRHGEAEELALAAKRREKFYDSLAMAMSREWGVKPKYKRMRRSRRRMEREREEGRMEEEEKKEEEKKEEEKKEDEKKEEVKEGEEKKEEEDADKAEEVIVEEKKDDDKVEEAKEDEKKNEMEPIGERKEEEEKKVEEEQKKEEEIEKKEEVKKEAVARPAMLSIDGLSSSAPSPHIDPHRLPADTPVNFRRVLPGMGDTGRKEPRVPEQPRKVLQKFTMTEFCEMLEWQAVEYQRQLEVPRVVPRAFYHHPLLGMTREQLMELPMATLQEHVEDCSSLLRSIFGLRKRMEIGQRRKRGGTGWRKRGKGRSGCSYSSKVKRTGGKGKALWRAPCLLRDQKRPLGYDPGRADRVRVEMERDMGVEKKRRKEQFSSAYSSRIAGWSSMSVSRRMRVLAARRYATRFVQRNRATIRPRYELWKKVEDLVFEPLKPRPSRVLGKTSFQVREEERQKKKEEKRRREDHRQAEEDLRLLASTDAFCFRRKVHEEDVQPMHSNEELDTDEEWAKRGEERKRFDNQEFFTDEDNQRIAKMQMYLDDTALIARQNKLVEESRKRAMDREEMEEEFQDDKRQFWNRYYEKRNATDPHLAPVFIDPVDIRKEVCARKRRENNRLAKHDRMLHKMVLARSVDYLLDIQMINTMKG